MSGFLAPIARISAYLVTFLLAAVWIFGALDSLTRPLFDLGRPHVGEFIVAAANVLGLPAERILSFAHLLVGLKLMVGALLLAALLGAVYETVRWGSSDDAMLDVALFTSAVASVTAALPGLIYGGEPLQAVVGELMLCVIASRLAIYGRGYLAREDLPPPTRPPTGYPHIG